MLYHHSTQRAWSNFSQAFSSTRGQMEVFLWLVTELSSSLMPFVRVHRVKCLEKWTDHHWQNCCLQFVLKQLISTEVSIYCKYKVSDSISKAFSLKAGDGMWVTVWRCEAAQLRLGIAGHHWGEHLALIIWLPTAPPRSLQSAPQSSDSATTLPARLYTDSSAWAGDGVEFSTLNKQGLRPPPLVSAFKRVSDESGREETRTLPSYVDRQCAQVRSVAQHHQHPPRPPLLRSTRIQDARWEIPAEPLYEVTTFPLKSHQRSRISHNLQPLTKKPNCF